MKRFDLSGKVAIVTGGNGGIGLGIAHGFAEAGANVVIAARNAEKTAAAIAEIEEAGGSAIFIQTDIRKPDECTSLVDETVRGLGGVDILVNNSGINFRKMPQEFTLDDWYQVIDTNLTAAFVLSQAVYPHFLKAGGGKIINIGSLMSFMGSPIGRRLRPEQGRHRAARQGTRLRLGEGQHPGQCHPPRMDRHAALRGSPRRYSRA